jgi:hypothetical protein
MNAFLYRRSGEVIPPLNLSPTANRWRCFPKYIVRLKTVVLKLRRGAPCSPRLLPGLPGSHLSQLVPKVG